jgi:peptide/nickel transport system substrate-binding protein
VRSLAAALALGLAVAACSGDDDDRSGGPAEEGTTTAAGGSTAPDGTGGSDTSHDGTGDGTVPGTTAALPPPVAGGRLTVGLTAEPNSLDPTAASNTAAQTIFAAVADTLMTRDPETDEVVPQLAESLTESADRLSWTLVLRDGVTFHDGTPLDGEAVRRNLERHRESLVTATFVEPITAIDVVDATTVVLRLEEPWVALPSVLASNPGIMLSPASIDELGSELGRHLVATGPYRLADWQPDVQMELVPNDDYWDADHPPLLDGIVARAIGDSDSRRSAYEAGDVDCFSVATSHIADFREGEDETRYVEALGLPILTIMNNSQPPFDDLRVRRAVALAIDADTIVEALSEGTAVAANGPFPPGSPYYVEDTGYPTFDPDQAAALIAEYEEETGGDAAFTYQTVSSSDAVELANALEQMWEDVGIDVEVDTSLDQTRLILSVVTGGYDMSLWQFQDFADPDLLLYNQFHSEGSLNFERYASADVDAALDEGRTSAEPAVRRAAYAEVVRALGRDVPVTFGAYIVNGVACRDTVAGAVPGAMRAVQMPLRLLYRTE